MSPWRTLFTLPLITTALVFSALPARATTLVPMDLREMAVASTLVVHGTVVGSESRWNEDRTLIVTDVRILVHDDLKGNAGGEITVTQMGGEVGKLRVDVPGAAAFRRGEETVLFLAPDSFGRLHVTGLSQGRFEVAEEPRTGRKVIRGLAAGEAAAFGVSGSARGLETTATAAGAGVPLDRFLGGVRGLIQEIDDKEGK